MNTRKRTIPWLALAAACAFGADDLPYGHRHFRPTPERPVGWRGDGSGLFPGANPVFQWDDPAVDSPVRKSDDGKDVDIDKMQTLSQDSEAKPAGQAATTPPRGKNIVWKVKLPDFGNGAPIVVADLSADSGPARVFVTAEKDRLICLDAADGKVLWEDNPNLDARPSNWGGSLGRSMPTPCSDGRHVYTKCTTGALICYALDGVKKWSFPLSNSNTELAIPSPVLVDGKVIVKDTLGGKVFAVDAASGKSVWAVDLSQRNGARDAVAANFDAYAVMRVRGRALLVDSAGHVLDAETGAVVANGLGRHGDRVDTWNGVMNCSIPGADGVNLFAHMWRWGGFKAGHTAAYLNGSTRLYAYRFGVKPGSADVDAQLLWENDRDFWGTARGAVIVGDRCFWVSKNMDELTVIRMKSGEVRTFPWIFGLWAHTNVYGSNPYGWIYPHCVSDGYFLYQQGGSGLTAVVLLAPVPRLLAINKTEKGIGGPTLHGERIYIHSRDHVYCIGDPAAETSAARFDEADRLASDGQAERSLAILGDLAEHPAPHIRCRAVRRMIERDGASSVPHVARALEDTHEWVHWVAIEAARRAADGPWSDAVASVPAAVKAPARATLLHMLAARGESAAAGAILSALSDSDDVVREAALAAAGAAEAATVVEAILVRYPRADEWEKRHMFAALAAMPGAEVNAALTAALSSASAVVRRDAAVLLGQRGAATCRPSLLTLRHDSDPSVRASAALALRDLATPDDLRAVIDWLLSAPGSEEEDELLRIAGRLMREHPDPEGVVKEIRTRWTAAGTPAKQILLVRVLGARPVPATFASLKGFLSPGVHADVSVAVAEELAAWPSAEARPILADLMGAGRPPRLRYAAYLGYVRSIAVHEQSLETRIPLLAKAIPLAPRADDRRFVFEACARIPDVRSLRVVANAMARDLGGRHAVSALTRLAPVTIEKDYAKTMACVKEAVSSAELYEDPDAVSRAAQQAELKACVDNLRAIASQKKLVTASGDVDGPDASVPDL